MGDPPDHCLICYAQVSIYHQPDPTLNLPQTLPNLFPEIPPQIFNRKSIDHGHGKLIVSPVCGQCSLVMREVKFALDQLEEIQRRIKNFQVKIRDDLLRAYRESCVSRDTHQESFLLRKNIVQKLDPNSIGASEEAKGGQRSAPGGPAHGSKRVRKPTIKQEYYYDESGDTPDDPQPSPDHLEDNLIIPDLDFRPNSPPDYSSNNSESTNNNFPMLNEDMDALSSAWGLKPLVILLNRCDDPIQSISNPPKKRLRRSKAEIATTSHPNLPQLSKYIEFYSTGTKCLICSAEYFGLGAKNSLKKHLRVFHGIGFERMEVDTFKSHLNKGSTTCPRCDALIIAKNRRQLANFFSDHLQQYHLIQPSRDGRTFFGKKDLKVKSEPKNDKRVLVKPQQDRPSTCPQCHKVFEGIATRHRMKRHFRNMHPLEFQLNEMKDEFKCTHEGCSAVFLKESYLVKHLPIHELSPEEVADGSKVRDFIYGAYVEAPNSSTNNKTESCNMCGRSFTGNQVKRRLLVHQRRIHGLYGGKKDWDKSKNPVLDPEDPEESFTDTICDICGEQFVGKFGDQVKKRLNDHKVKKHQVWECPTCKDSFKGEGMLKRHNLIYHEKNQAQIQIRCEETGCTGIFSSQKRLETHKRRYHSTTEDSFLCEICSASFPSDYILKTHHLKAHEQKFKCSACGIAYSSKLILECHLKKIHGIGDPLKYQCKVCPYQSNRRTNYAQHIVKHDSTRDWVCEHCPHRCKTKNELRAHLIQKHIEASFTCTFCDRKFAMARELRNHVTVKHEGTAARIKCDYCEKTFPLRRYMRNHVRAHHKVELELEETRRVHEAVQSIN